MTVRGTHADEMRSPRSGGSSRWLHLLAPDEVADRVADINLGALRARGIEGILVDVDNTLVPWGSCDMDSATEAWVQRAKQEFSVCLLSNSVRGRRVRRLAAMLDVPGVSAWGMGRKPLAGGFMRALRTTHSTPERAAMIGDQLLADVLGGNRCGMYTIWVKLISEHEFIGTRLARVIERHCARKLRASGLLPDDGAPRGGGSPGHED